MFLFFITSALYCAGYIKTSSFPYVLSSYLFLACLLPKQTIKQRANNIQYETIPITSLVMYIWSIISPHAVFFILVASYPTTLQFIPPKTPYTGFVNEFILAKLVLIVEKILVK